jgi:hypothetical protein
MSTNYHLDGSYGCEEDDGLQLPIIKEKGQLPKFDSPSTSKNHESLGYLPPLSSKHQHNSSSFSAVQKTSVAMIIPESSVVVGIKGLSSSQQPKEMREWKEQLLVLSPSKREKTQSLNEMEEEEIAPFDIQKTKVEWENDIARHILSLYATTSAVKNIREANSLLDFVGERQQRQQPSRARNRTKNGGGMEVEEEQEEYEMEEFDKMNITTELPSFSQEKRKKTKKQQQLTIVETEEEEEEEEEGIEAENNNRGEEKPASKEKAKVKKRKTKKKLLSSSISKSRSLPHITTQEEQNLKNKQFIDSVLAKIESTVSLKNEKDKYRITNTIRTRDGKEIVVRGSPKCFPIWFISSGDVFVDWTALPGMLILMCVYMSSLLLLLPLPSARAPAPAPSSSLSFFSCLL